MNKKKATIIGVFCRREKKSQRLCEQQKKKKKKEKKKKVKENPRTSNYTLDVKIVDICGH